MTGKGNKTEATAETVPAFIASVEHPVRRQDAQTLLALYRQVTGEEPTMWGPSIIGFGSYHYRYDSGREGDMCRSGFSPRKANLVLYLMGGYCDADTMDRLTALRERLGKHKTGSSCLYITKLADVDMAVLEEMIRIDREAMDSAYPD